MLSAEEIQRYSRHLRLAEVGESGQLLLKRARVLVVGVGGLGAPATLYLAAAGVGRLGLVDFDVVEHSNLQRQVIFGTSAVGRSKLAVARERISDLNPNVDVVAHDMRMDGHSALDIIEQYDVVVDGSDNFATRYLLSDACVLLGKPDVYGSVLRFTGQASVLSRKDGPCYRCLFPSPPNPDETPSCAEAGVLGVLPGIIGSIQATETIKLVLGKGGTLTGRLLIFDALEMRFRELRVGKNPDCPICGANPSITELADYDDFCGASGHKTFDSSPVPEIEPRDVRARLDSGREILLLDVRDPHERALCHIGGLLVPIGEIPTRLPELDPEREIVVYCRTGVRSARVVEILLRSGFNKVWNLRGGLHAWSDQVDPSIPKY
jgi:molybdopterin/thiamine biosynthesis adenylyltransferase/rhodanese-related sulfurtransferase